MKRPTLKVGDKVRLSKKSSSGYLTYGKEYEVVTIRSESDKFIGASIFDDEDMRITALYGNVECAHASPAKWIKVRRKK